MKKFNRAARVAAGFAAAFALAAAGVVAVAAPAQAAAPGNCQTLGNACVYSGYDYGTDWAQNGRMLYFESCIDNLGNYSYNDIISSLYNNGRYDSARFFEHDLARGASFTVLRGDGRARLGSDWNDRITSAYFSTNVGSAGSAKCA